MKLTSTILFASTISAAPLTMTAPTRRVSQELEFATTTITTTTTAPVPELAAEVSIGVEAAPIDLAKVDLGADDADFEEYMQFLEDLPEVEWEAIFDSLTSAIEERLGLDINELEKLSDDEFDSLLKTM